MIRSFKKLRWKMLSFGTHGLALPALRFFLHPRKFPYTLDDLEKMHKGTAGAMLYDFLDQNGFELLKDYESHDIKHVILGYGGNEENEAALQYFMLGNGWVSLPVITTIAITFFLMPEHHRSFRNAYKRGRRTPPLRGTDWFALIPLPIEEVTKKIKIPPHEC